MTDTPEVTAPDAVPEPVPTAAAAPAKPAKKPKKEEDWKDTAWFVVKLIVVVIVFRSFLFSPFSIPSQSMLPRLYIGDYVFVSKWNYGYSKHSLPWSWPLIPGRIFGSNPARGDVVVFKAPPNDDQDYIKRVIGLPGDTIQMRGGQLILNGVPVPKVRVADFVIPITPNYPLDTVKPMTDQCDPRNRAIDGSGQPVCRIPGECPDQFKAADAAGKPICRYMQFKETLPNGVSYTVLDRGEFPDRDDTGLYTVPAGKVFLMGDNRDNSGDSRFPAEPGGAVGMVPLENLEGKAVLSFWSTDGSASWVLPWTWFSAARWERIGQGF